MAWIVVRNWERFQHYRNRNPVWIKTYLELLDNDAYLGLPPRARALLHGVWMAYARARGELRYEPDASPMRRRYGSGALDKRVRMRVYCDDIKRLSDAGFIEVSASKPLASCYQAASVEEEEEKEPYKALFSSDRSSETEAAARSAHKVPLAANRSDNGARPWECPYCSSEWATEDKLYEHIVSCEGSP